MRRVQEEKGTTIDMHSERVILGLQACKEGRRGSGSERGWCPVTRFRQKGIRPLESERRGKANQKRGENEPFPQTDRESSERKRRKWRAVTWSLARYPLKSQGFRWSSIQLSEGRCELRNSLLVSEKEKNGIEVTLVAIYSGRSSTRLVL